MRRSRDGKVGAQRATNFLVDAKLFVDCSMTVTVGAPVVFASVVFFID